MHSLMHSCMEMFSERVGDYFLKALNESEYFDFMTLMRRIYAHPGLMDFESLLLNGLMVLEDEPNIGKAASEYARLSTIVNLYFGELNVQVSLEDLKKTVTYRLRKSNRYSFMEVFWAHWAWQSWGSDTQYSGLRGILDDLIESVKQNESSSEKMAKPNISLSLSADLDVITSNDLIQFIFCKLDAKLVNVKERVINGSLSIEEVASDSFVLLH